MTTSPTLLRVMVATLLYSTPSIRAVGTLPGCRQSEYELDIGCNDIIFRDNSEEFSTFHFYVDFPGTHIFETCSALMSPTTVNISTDTAIPIEVTTGLSTHDCGPEGFGTVVSVDLTYGDYIAVVDQDFHAKGLFRFGMVCPTFPDTPTTVAFRAAIDIALTPVSDCDDHIAGLETCDSYRLDLEHKIGMKPNHFGGLDPSFVCENPLHFQPNQTDPHDAELTCDSMIRSVMGEALYNVGNSLELAECSVEVDWYPFLISDVTHMYVGGLSPMDCCDGKGWTTLCADAPHYQRFPPLNTSAPTAAPTPPPTPGPTWMPTTVIGSTGGNKSGGVSQDHTTVIVVAVVLTVLTSAVIVGVVYVKVHTGGHNSNKVASVSASDEVIPTPMFRHSTATAQLPGTPSKSKSNRQFPFAL